MDRPGVILLAIGLKVTIPTITTIHPNQSVQFSKNQIKGRYLVLLATLISTLASSGQNTVLDAQLNPVFQGTNGVQILAIAQGTNGTFAVGGSFTNVGGKYLDGIALFRKDGTLEPLFTRSAFQPNSSVRAIAAERSGSFIVAASRPSTTPPPTMDVLQRIAADGTSTTFTRDGGGAHWPVQAVVIDANDKILVAGPFVYPRQGLARLNNNGQLDTSFDPQYIFTNPVSAIAVQPDGRIIAGGSNYVLRLNSNGTEDGSFGLVRLNGQVHALTIQGDGKILVGGTFSTVNTSSIRPKIVRLTPAGAVDLTFGTNQGPDGLVRNIVLQSDGSVLIGGDFMQVQGIACSGIARLSSLGAVDPHFNERIALNGPVTALMNRAIGSVVVGGAFSTVGSTARTGLGQLNRIDLAIKSIKALTNGIVQVTAKGTAGLSIDLQGSEDFGQWQTISNVSLPSGLRSIPITASTNFRHRFYRVNTNPNLPLEAGSIVAGGLVQGVAWTGEQFICGEDSGRVRTSAEGLRWSRQTAGQSSNIIFAAASDQHLNVVVGSSGFIATSPDGISWTTRSSAAKAHYGVGWNGSRFLAVGDSGLFLSSSDGIHWNTEASGTTNRMRGIVWDGGQWVATGSAGTVLTSPDGISWVSRASGRTNDLLSVTDGSGLLAAVGANGTIITSTDGILWTSRSAGTTTSLRGMCWDGAQFIVVGSGGTILTSPDGITWTNRISGVSETLTGVASNGQILVVVGANRILTSSDGVSWIERTGTIP